MTEPRIRFKKEDGTNYKAWSKFVVSDVFEKIKSKNKDGKITNVITNSAEFGLLPQRMYFDKDIAIEGNTGNYTIISRGDFVYNPRKSSSAPMGPFNRYNYDEEGIVSPLYTCLKPNGKLNSDYLLWYFQTDKWHQFVSDNGAQNGARHDRVGMNDAIMMSIPILAPEEDEQQKIVDFLSNVDEVIAASEEETANLEQQKKAVMQKIFSQEVRFKKEDGNDFPDWENCTLVSMCDSISDGDWIESKDQSELGVRLIQTGNVGIGTFINKAGKEKWISEETFARLRCKEVKPGTILVSRLPSPAGRACIVPDTGSKMITAVDCSIVCVNDDYCDDYIVQYLCSSNYFKDVEAFLAGGTRKRISRGNLETIIVPIPTDNDEQQLIADFLTSYDDAITAAKQELAKWKELKKGLLQQMFV